MSFDDFLPDWAILREPVNWIVVALALAMFFFIIHMAFAPKSKENA